MSMHSYKIVDIKSMRMKMIITSYNKTFKEIQVITKFQTNFIKSTQNSQKERHVFAQRIIAILSIGLNLIFEVSPTLFLF